MPWIPGGVRRELHYRHAALGGPAAQSPPVNPEDLSRLPRLQIRVLLRSGFPCRKSYGGLGQGQRAFRAGLCGHGVRTYVRAHKVVQLQRHRTRPGPTWLVLGSDRHTTERDHDIDFLSWAAHRWPPARFTVQLNPSALTSRRNSSGYGGRVRGMDTTSFPAWADRPKQSKVHETGGTPHRASTEANYGQTGALERCTFDD